MRYKIFSIVEKKHPKGAALFYGEASATALNSIQIAEALIRDFL